MRNFSIFEQNEATIPIFIYKTIFKHQEKELRHVLNLKRNKLWSVPAHFKSKNAKTFPAT